MSAPEAPLGPGLVARRVLIPRAEVAWLRYLLEAEDGLGFVYGDGRGAVLVIGTEAQAHALDGWLTDVLPGLGASVL